MVVIGRWPDQTASMDTTPFAKPLVTLSPHRPYSEDGCNEDTKTAESPEQYDRRAIHRYFCRHLIELRFDRPATIQRPNLCKLLDCANDSIAAIRF